MLGLPPGKSLVWRIVVSGLVVTLLGGAVIALDADIVLRTTLRWSMLLALAIWMTPAVRVLDRRF